MQQTLFGTTRDGRQVHRYTLASENLRLQVLDYGAAIQTLLVKDKDGRWRDVVLGYDTMEEYETRDGYFGACIGRVGNRIGKGVATLHGQTLVLAKNDGENHLHGGNRGFDKQLWQGQTDGDFVRFSRLSPDGEEGYPGNLEVSVTYRLTGNALQITYDALSDQDTLCSLTNHSYWNLNGEGSVLAHTLRVQAEAFLENDAHCLPTGRILPVEGTPFDFRSPKTLGRDIRENDRNLQNCGGYDHNFCLSGKAPAAVLHSAQSGITMEVETTLPGMQVYSGNFLTRRRGKGGAVYNTRDALCLETQYYPNAMACEGFLKPILRAGERYHQETNYIFWTQAEE